MRPFVVLLLAVLFGRTATAVGAGVVVTLPSGLPLDGCTIRVYSWTPGEDWPKVVGEQPVKDARVTLDLPDGDYGIEVGGVRGTSVVLLRNGRFTVPQQKRVDLAGVRVRCTAKIDKADARLAALSVRRLGSGVEKWAADEKSADARPDLIVSPGESYAAAIVAESKTAVLALWKTIKPEKAPWSFASSDAEAVYSVAADVADGTPPLRAAAVRFAFPETSVRLADAHKGRRLLTNRDRALVSYDLLTRAGESLRFSDQAIRFDRQSKLSIGGKLTATLFAAPVYREDGSNWTPFLVRRLYLCDPNGRWVDLPASSFRFTCDMTWGTAALPAKESDEILLQGKEVKSSDVTARVTFRYGGLPVEQKPTAAGFVEVKSARVKLAAPEALLGRARRFARMVEAVADIDRSLAKRPGPNSWQVDWRYNGNNAKSIVGNWNGGGWRVWGSYPYAALERFTDPFVEPDFGGNGDPFVAHELLHTFGYNHGDDMSKLEWAAEDAYRRLRWQAADTGVWAVWDD